MPAPPDAEAQSRFLLDLYRAAHEQPAAPFQGWVLERLAHDLAFDSALWATASATEAGPVGHTAHLHRQPAQMIAEYETLKHLDTLNAASVQQPGKTLFVVTREYLPAAVHPYLERYGLEQAMTTLAYEPQTAVYSVLSLYRADRGRPFTAAEAQAKQALFPHLVEADSRNKLIDLERHSRNGIASHWQSAAIDAQGLVRHVSDGFKALALREWPDWRGPYLPVPLRALIAGTPLPADTLRHTVAQLPEPGPLALGPLRLVQLRERHAVDELPHRMREVARLAADGMSTKQIAAALRISPNTVRNQLVEVYDRLAVKNKAEMAGIVHRYAEGPGPGTAAQPARSSTVE
jgi:DNA-binding CsgD family transcriptional regulator